MEYPHSQANAASFKAETEFLAEIQDVIDRTSIRSRRSSVAHRPSDAQDRLSLAGGRQSNASSRARFDRSWLAPLSEARHAHDSSAVDDDDAASIHTAQQSALERRLTGMTARSSFHSAFRAVYGSLAVPGAHATGLNLETSALLSKSASTQGVPEPAPQPPLPGESDNPFIVELGIISRYTLPILGTQFAQYSLLVASVVFVGRLSTVDLAGASLGSMTANMLAFSIIQGFSSALDSLVPQAYASAEPTLASLYAQRTAVLIFLLMLPQAFLFWNAERAFLALSQPPEVAQRAALYLKVMSAALPAYGCWEVLRKWLQGQNRFQVATYVVLAVAPINALVAYFLVIGPIDKIRLGFIGAPLSTVISFYLMFIFGSIYAVFFLPKDAWGGWRLDAFRSLGVNFKLGIAGVFMICSEWWAWELAAIGAAYISPEALACQSVLGVITSLAYQLPFAISAACAVRVANLIGAGYGKLAKKSSRTGLALAVVLGLAEGGLLAIFKDTIGKLFINDPKVVALVATIMPVIALFQVSDGVCGVASGLLRGAGRAAVGAVINVAAYYVIGLPLGFALTFYASFGLKGIWLGLTTGLTFTAVFETIYLLLLDWQAEVIRAGKRIASDMTTIQHHDYEYGTIEE